MPSGSAVDVAPFDALPEPVLRVIFLALPVDVRAQAACVCRGWRAFLSDPSLWQVLDLTAAGGLEEERYSENLVRGAVARAGGQLRVLSFNRVLALDVSALLVAMIVSNGADLQQVNTDLDLRVQHLHAVFAAAPRLQVLNAGIVGNSTALLPFLRNDAPYGPLRVSNLDVSFGAVSADDVFPFATAVAAHKSLECLNFQRVRFAPGLNALVDAATERRVSSFQLNGCTLDAESIPAMARLLQRGSLMTLDVECIGFPHEQEDSMLGFCAALRLCRTLTHLRLWLRPHNGAARRVITELLNAVTSLPALSVLDLWGSEVQDTTAFGQALGVLLGANLPSLRTFRVDRCHLVDAGMGLLLDGLAANTHLRELRCEFNDLSEAFKRDRLEPALAALAARAQLDE